MTPVKEKRAELLYGPSLGAPGWLRGFVLGPSNRRMLERRPAALRGWYTRVDIETRMTYDASFVLLAWVPRVYQQEAPNQGTYETETTARAERPKQTRNAKD